MKDEIKKVKCYNDEDECYLYRDMEKHYKQVIELSGNCYLFLSIEDEFCMQFALMQNYGEDGDNIFLIRIFSGSGTRGSLREMRHIWWGDEEGYTFYLPGKSVIEALTKLQEYFDFD